MSDKTTSSFHNDIWINEAIDSLRFIDDVGQTDLHFLDHILPHCSVEQLMHIEKSSKGRDLTPITDKLWKNFYEKKFGKDASNLVIERMKHKNESLKWKQLYETKMKALEKKIKEIEDRFIQNCQKEKARKQSRQIKFCEISSSGHKKRSFERTTKSEYNTAPSKLLKKQTAICGIPSTNNKKRMFGGTTKLENNPNKSKMAKREACQSLEMKNLTICSRNAVRKY